MSGILITFEGADGLGKGTQVGRLVDALRSAGNNVLSTKEPGTGTLGSHIGPIIRETVFLKKHRLQAGADQVLFLADHVDNVARFMENLRDGDTVVCDRYADSAFAYAQAYDSPTSPEILAMWRTFYGPVPDITILLAARGPVVKLSSGETAMDTSWALARARKRKGIEGTWQNNKAWNDFTSHRAIQSAYLKLLENEHRTVIVWIDENDDEDTVHSTILASVTERILEIRERAA